MTGQLIQPFNYDWFEPPTNQIDENVTLYNRFPIAHTMFLWFVVVHGNKLLGSGNAGVFLYVCLQVAISVVAYAGCISMLIKAKAPGRYATVPLLVFALHPRVHNFLFVVSKDVLYSAAFMVLLLSAYLLLSGDKSKKNYAVLVVSSLLVFLNRSEGIYILVSLYAILLLSRNARTCACVMLPLVIVFSLLWTNVLLPHYKVSPGSRREMLSLPFQQTARYLSEYPEDVTDEELAAISGIFKTVHLEESYEPNISDPVKELYLEEATKDDLANYLRAWYGMFKRHPKVYVAATLANKYKFVYPCTTWQWDYAYSWSAACMEKANTYLKTEGFDFHYSPRFERERDFVEHARPLLSDIPLVGIFVCSATYTLLFLYVLTRSIRVRDPKLLMLCVPIVVLFLVIVAGPTNGDYFRYVYPVFLVDIPLLLLSHGSRAERWCQGRFEREAAVA